MAVSYQINPLVSHSVVHLKSHVMSCTLLIYIRSGFFCIVHKPKVVMTRKNVRHAVSSHMTGQGRPLHKYKCSVMVVQSQSDMHTMQEGVPCVHEWQCNFWRIQFTFRQVLNNQLKSKYLWVRMRPTWCLIGKVYLTQVACCIVSSSSSFFSLFFTFSFSSRSIDVMRFNLKNVLFYYYFFLLP